MKISAIFPSKYVKAADLEGRTVTLTITKLTMEEMVTHDNKNATKPVLWFERATKGFVLNLTNALIIANLYGDEADNWKGKRISLYPTRVKAFGSMQDCIRVREEIPAQPRPPTQAAQVEETTGLDDDEDVADHGYDDDEGQQPPPSDEAPDPLWDAPAPPRATQAELDALDAIGKAYYGADAWVAKLPTLVMGVTTGTTNNPRELKPSECARLIRKIKELQANALHPVANGKAVTP